MADMRRGGPLEWWVGVDRDYPGASVMWYLSGPLSFLYVRYTFKLPSLLSQMANVAS